MLGPPVTLRCPACGALLWARPAPGAYPAWVPCPTCGRPVAVVAPRDPPPLFSWEAYPQLYTFPGRPRTIGPAAHRLATLLLVVVTLLLLAGAGLLLDEGAQAVPAHGYTVGGTVTAGTANGSSVGPLAGAWVNISGENGFLRSLRTGTEGRFLVHGVPAGGITVSAAAPGEAPVTLDLFADPVYSSPSGPLTNLALTLRPGTPSEAATYEETAYPDLESLLAVLLSGSTLLGIAAAVGAVGIVEVARHERYTWAVAGGSAGGLAPLVLVELGLNGIAPFPTVICDIGAVVGLVALVLGGAALALTRSPEPPDS